LAFGRLQQGRSKDGRAMGKGFTGDIKKIESGTISRVIGLPRIKTEEDREGVVEPKGIGKAKSSHMEKV